jgi:hypothetical protein
MAGRVRKLAAALAASAALATFVPAFIGTAHADEGASCWNGATDPLGWTPHRTVADFMFQGKWLCWNGQWSRFSGSEVG